ncbi:MAG: DUF3015 domain-containing protein [Bdellovibrionaceae bacterium]|nr:DUF3015 domain-containing protein [Pseudobdellovibrionaceae bacterium]NUM58849.1 DUF3015 family protein [Pseudobdellovibrionaceae bacterium]
MSKKILAVVAGVTFSALNLFAAGDAGCGLGSVVISKNSKGLQLVALTTNGSFSSQPLGITSGTSNCSSSGIVSNEKEIEYYVEVNKSELLKDMAKGDGESLDAFASLYGCQTASSKKEFKEITKSQFEIINSNKENHQIWIKNLNTVLKANKDKVHSCNVI